MPYVEEAPPTHGLTPIPARTREWYVIGSILDGHGKAVQSLLAIQQVLYRFAEN
jgi:hypothetical protein